MPILGPEMQRAACQGDPNCISKALTTQKDHNELAEKLQERRLARLFFLSPDVAATIARFAYGAAQ